MLDTAQVNDAPTLKAYQVSEPYEGEAVVVFSRSSVEARRKGADALGTEFRGVESCRRAPELDRYAPGPVPPMALLENGWWFQCVNCGTQVSMDSEEDDDGNALVPCVSGQDVYCSPACRSARLAYERSRHAAISALVEWVQTRYPSATRIQPHVYSSTLERVAQNAPPRSSVSFKLPELSHPVVWEFGHTQVKVSTQDIEVFQALYGKKDQERKTPR